MLQSTKVHTLSLKYSFDSSNPDLGYKIQYKTVLHFRTSLETIVNEDDVNEHDVITKNHLR